MAKDNHDEIKKIQEEIDGWNTILEATSQETEETHFKLQIKRKVIVMSIKQFKDLVELKIETLTNIIG